MEGWKERKKDRSREKFEISEIEQKSEIIKTRTKEERWRRRDREKGHFMLHCWFTGHRSPKQA